MDKGTVTVTDGGDPGKLKVSTLDGTTSTCVAVMADATFQNGAFSLKVKFPSGSSTARAGFVFAHDDNDTYYAIVLRKNSGTDTIEMVKYTSGSGWGSPLAVSNSITINNETSYELRGFITQRHVTAWVVGQSNQVVYDRSTSRKRNRFGLVATKTGVTFDDFKLYQPTPYDPAAPGWVGLAATTLDTGNNKLTGTGIKVWVAGQVEWDGSDATDTIAWGAVALSGWQAKSGRVHLDAPSSASPTPAWQAIRRSSSRTFTRTRSTPCGRCQQSLKTDHGLSLENRPFRGGNGSSGRFSSFLAGGPVWRINSEWRSSTPLLRSGSRAGRIGGSLERWAFIARRCRGTFGWRLRRHSITA